jgi:hypothetical protein
MGLLPLAVPKHRRFIRALHGTLTPIRSTHVRSLSAAVVAQWPPDSKVARHGRVRPDPVARAS